jgi:hypothetical protein
VQRAKDSAIMAAKMVSNPPSQAAFSTPLSLCLLFFSPAAPGGTASEEYSGQGQNPDGDGNRTFTGGDHDASGSYGNR